MEFKRKLWLFGLSTLASILLLVSLLSLFYQSSIWWIKILNFPRIQLWLLGLVLLIAVFWALRKYAKWRWILLGITTISLIIHTWYLLPYTFLAAKQVRSADDESIHGTTFSVFIANVYMNNRKVNDLIALIEKSNPDIVLLMETDLWWQDQLGKLKSSYPYYMEYPLENTYGMLLYSRFPLENSDILFLEHSKVPTFSTNIILNSEQQFRFFGVHPVAPVISKKYPDNEGTEAGGLEKVSQLVAKVNAPVLVAGDYNDVAWSDHIRLFKDDSRLNDVREGRGFYNSFDASSILMRWPLDHIFVSQQFMLIELERLPSFGSDHFPIFAKFVLTI